MVANVETMMYAGAVPWHGKGVYVGDDNVLSAEALTLSGCDWTVSKIPLWVHLPGDGGAMKVESHMAIMRDTDKAVLGVVGRKYVPFQNKDAFSLMDRLVTEGKMRYHTAGSLDGGKKVWLLGKVASFSLGAGKRKDRVDQYLFLWATHDGTGAVRVFWTSVRVVCANTARAALSQADARKEEGVYLRHTKNIADEARLERAREVLGLATKAFKAEEEFARALHAAQMKHEAWTQFAQVLIPDPKSEDEEREISPARAQAKRELLEELLRHGRGAEETQAYDTLWGARCAVVELANYHQGVRISGQGDVSEEMKQSRRFDSSLFGSGATLIKRADTLLEQMLNDQPLAA